MDIVVSQGRALATDVYNLGGFGLVVASKASSSRGDAKAEGRFGLVVASKVENLGMEIVVNKGRTLATHVYNLAAKAGGRFGLVVDSKVGNLGMEIVVNKGRTLATHVYNLGGRFALLVAPKASRRGAKEARSCRRAAEGEGEARRFGLVAAKETSIGSSFEASLEASLVASLEASAKAFSVEGWLVRSRLTPFEGWLGSRSSRKTSKHP